MDRRIRATAASLTALLVLGACGADAGSDPQGNERSTTAAASTDDKAADPGGRTVAIARFAYEPKVFSVDRGTSVTWTNEDDIAHTVTSGRPKKQGVPGVSEDRVAEPDGVFDSGVMELDDTFSFTFEDAGSYTYYCDIHSGMVAKIDVR